MNKKTIGPVELVKAIGDIYLLPAHRVMEFRLDFDRLTPRDFDRKYRRHRFYIGDGVQLYAEI